MANWNLSVDLRGQGADLARTLQTSARHARDLANAVRDAQGEIQGLATTSRTAQGAITGVGRASDQARNRLVGMARQARSAAGEFRDLARAAELAERRLQAAMRDVRITARLDDETGPGRAALRTAITEIQRLSPVRIRVQFDGDATQIAAAAAAMRDLRTHADRTDAALTALATRGAAAALALRAAEEAASDLARTLRTLRGRAAAAAAALDELRARALTAAGGLRSLNTTVRTADGRLDSLSGRTRTLRGDLDDLDGSLRRVGGRMGDLRGSVGRVGSATGSASKGTKNMMAGAVALATALIPVASAVVPIAAGMTAAGAAVGVFGVAVAGQIVALTESANAEEKYEKAVREHGQASTEAATAEKEYLRTISEMPPATREAAAGLAALKDQYKTWSNALAGDTMPVVTKSMALFGAMLPRLTPLVKGTSKELDRLLTVAAGGMSTPGFDRFVTSFTRFANESLARGTTGLIKFTQALDTGQIGSNLKEFLDYARSVGPLVADTLGNLAQAATHLLVAASDMGVSVLQVVDAFARLVTAIPTGVLSTMLQLYAAFKLVSLGAAALGAVTGSAAIARLGAYFAVMRAAGVATTLRATAASMSMMTKASIGLGVLAVAAVGIGKLAEKARGAPPDVDRLTTSLKELAVTGKMTGEFKKTFGDVDGLVKKMGELGKAAKDNDEYVKSFGNSGFGPLDDLRKKANDLWQDFTKGDKSITALKDDFGGLDEAMAGMVSSGYGKQAASDFSQIQAAAKKAGYSTKEIADLFPKYQDAVAASAAEQKLAAAGMGLFGQQALDTKAKLDAQRASTDGLRQSIVALNDVNRAALGGMIGFEAGIDAAAKAAKENAGSLRMVNGELDLNSPKAQAAATALADLGAKTDAAAGAARDSGKSWEYVNGIYQRGEQAIIKNAMAMGLSKAEATAFAATVLTIPDKKSTLLEMRTEDAMAGLDSVIAKIKATPGAKSVTVTALTTDAVHMLERLGYRVETLPDGRFKVTALTGEAAAGLAGLQRMRDGLKDKTIRLTTIQTTVRRTIAENNTIGRPISGEGGESAYANGGVVDYYANGGIQRGGVRNFAGGSENHVAQIAPAGSWRVWGEPETMGEGYVPFAPSKRPRSRAITEEIVRRLGGDPRAIQWNAAGSVTDWRYDPQSGSLYSASDAGQAGNKTKKVKVKGGKGKTKDVEYFDLKTVEKQLKSNSKATKAWNKDLEKVADRVGGDVADALAAMGKDGVALAKKMANGSTKYINEMAAALRGLAETAKASLTDYTRQLTKATTADSTFQKNLSTLAGKGYGDLAAQLAAQGDTAAQQLAAAAVKDPKKAGAANTAAKKSNNALTSDQVQQLVAIIAAVKTSKTGIHDVADTTGLGEDEIIATATKAQSQIKSSLGSRATKFLGDLARANKGLSYANGGIRSGIYSTRGGAVTFAEPETGGEAFIPLGPNKRTAATNVLRDVAGRFGHGLTDVAATRPVVIVQGGGDTNVNVTAVRTGASASDIGAQVGRSVRRARRGGVNARAAA
ncbi:hypothetical protein [Streptomyces sp. BE133]|uniref:hypothetical protein n=1 Tax=Streptomyces sp. BE133 TaxID=3002523 RepID=UPI002E7A85E3|nr:hypothetical protein [Streptomyces sp. BE133]MEE1812709.1 hypothetical protein [Streptomyces sp. BE133]